MDAAKRFERDVRNALGLYLATVAERGPRGGKPTVSTVAGAGRGLADRLGDALRKLEASGEWRP